MSFDKCGIVRFLVLPLLLTIVVCNSSFAQDTTTNCVDSDGDGWGWDGANSCRLTEDLTPEPEFSTQFCTDTDGDGWGWNGTDTCVIEHIDDNTCIDTDGDGWGWDGESSCLIDNQSGCIDTDGDGWGWNGYQTCLLTDPGNNGQSNAKSCIINGTEVSTQIDQFQCDALLNIYAITNGNSWNNNEQWATSTDPCNWHGVICANDSVYELELSANNLTGTLPDSIGSLHAMKILRLSSNQLTGTIPASIGSLSNLEVLYINDNELTGTIPPEIGALSNLEVLYLYGNQLNGPIPREIGDLGNLAVLDLSDNAIDGNIPDTVGDMDSLFQLFLNDNFLSGNIPANIGNLPSLEILDLSSNILTGKIPDTFSNPDLILFNASNNQLSGNLDSISNNITNNGTFLILHGNQCFTTTDADLVTLLNGFGPPHWNDGCL